jgi:small subunit ribosomal protein S9
MADDEQKDVEAAQDEEPQDEGAGAAGPDAAEEASGLTRPETSSATPPAEEADESDDSAAEAGEEAEEQDEAPAAEPAAEPVAEQEEPVAEQEAPAPETEKKKDVIPGADLEPIAVEPEERPLSAEEQARKEAEDEERAQKEAALAATTEEEQAASRAPAKMDGDSRFLATGKRKNAIARVTLLPGGGEFVVNGRPLEEFFPRPLHQTTARQALATSGYEGSVDVRVRVHGGGISGQAGAIRHGVARALTEVDPELRIELKRRGYLTRDARAKERRKAGLKKARKRPQFSKR